MNNCYVLDACALLALLHDEPGAAFVADVICAANIGEADVSMHKVNLLEVYYDVYRSLGKAKADNVIREIQNQPIAIRSDISDSLFEETGRLKASYKISFADAFALATASVMRAALLTADHHEMDTIEQSEPGIQFLWIR
ncbi:MAG: PIN domain-containing protein [Oscillospiraceae bacterium]|jgi:predicted nucleic acid-binding protein|nr:PIN domain-containing protein [Oscillospiraceae bacterium]